MKPVLQRLSLPGNTSFVTCSYRTPYFETPHHQHGEHELILIRGSTGRVFIGDYIGEYCPGQVYLLGAHLPHWFRKEEETMTGWAVVAHFREDFWGPAFLALPEMQAVRQLLRLSARGLRLKGNLNGRLAALLTGIEVAEGLSRLRRLLVCLDDISRSDAYDLLTTSCQRYPPAPYQEKINKVFEFTLAHYWRKINVAEVADLVHLSPSAFCHYFKRATRKRYVHFVNEIRIGNACRLLAETKLTVLEVCYESGFHNWANFSKHFKAFKQMTPTQFRNLCQHRAPQ
ncbi:MAG TPA: AraC family transcriptional regulator [Cytophagales bacterium]|jgi:AraC-like DNA-binding protein